MMLDLEWIDHHRHRYLVFLTRKHLYSVLAIFFLWEPKNKKQIVNENWSNRKLNEHIPGDFPLKLTAACGVFCGVLFDEIAVVDVLNAELYETDIFDVFALAFKLADDPFNFFCHRGIGPLPISPSIMNALLISLK